MERLGLVFLSVLLTCVFAQNSELPCTSNPCLNSGTCFDSADTWSYFCDCLHGYEGSNCEITLPGICPGDFICQNSGVCNLTPGGVPICLCSFGFTGDRCQNVSNAQDPCLAVTCQNGGSCVTIDSGSYLCRCPDGFSGTSCETVISPCLSTSCLNGGTCLVHGDGTNSYICICPATHYGESCENLITPVNCASDPCRNGGTCYNPASDSLSGFLCVCPNTHTGKTCETSVSVACSPSPCLNNGMCIEIGQNYTCHCLAGFKGNNCEINVDECFSSPCVHGTCIDVINGFYCECEGGWEGQTCNTQSGTTVDPCTSTPCGNGGSCLASSDLATFLCICTPEFTGDRCQTDSTQVTSSPDLCSIDTCLNGGSCISSSLPGISYIYCICAQGFVGQFCEIDDGGVCVNNPCHNGGTCNPHPFSPGGYFCTCLTDFTGSLCEVDERPPPSPCESSPCTHNGTCFTEAENADYFCRCRIGYSGRHCEISGPCVSQPCQNGGTCLEDPHNNNNYMCHCSHGYVGMTCSDSLPEDLCSPNPCMNYGECMLTSDNVPPSSPFISPTAEFWCQCPDGFTGTYCQATDPCASSPCLNGGSCGHLLSSVGAPMEPTGFWCQCTVDFIGETCSERGPCESNPCLNGGSCIIHAMTAYDPLYGGDFDASLYSFFCQCPTGFTGDTCETVDLPPDNPCSSSPCQNGGTCFANVGVTSSSFYCQCPIQFVGYLCEGMGPCESSPCSNGATCLPTIVSPTFSLFYCICPHGFAGNLCTTPVSDPCSSDPCENSGSCSVIMLPSDSTFTCSCPPEFTGHRCETPIANPCDSNPCLNDGTCLREIRDDGPAYGSRTTFYACQCPHGFTGGHCQITQCTHELEVYSEGDQRQESCNTCFCNNGNWACTEIACVPNCEEQPCLNDGTCMMDESSSKYMCICDDRYFGDRCEYEYVLPNPCDEMPCLNGGSCTQQGSGHVCECPLNYRGTDCEIEVINECFHDGSRYVNGDRRTEHCNTCICDNGDWTCTEYICECTYGLEVYSNGEHRQESCNTCICNNGDWFCTEMFCGNQCYFMDELYTQGDMRTEDCNTCTCLNSDWICTELKCEDECKEDDKQFEDCNECFCKNGKWVCTTKTCSKNDITNVQFSFTREFSYIYGKEETFMRDLQKDLASEFDLPIHLIQNMQVSPGSIVVNFDIAQDADFDLDLNLLLEVEEAITSNSYNFMFEGVSYRPDPNSFKTVTRSDPNVVDNKQTEEDDEEEIDMLIIAIGAGGGLLVFAFIAIVVTCFYKRKKVPDNLDFFRKEMEGIPNNTLSAKVQEPIHRVRTLPPGYKYNDYEESE